MNKDHLVCREWLIVALSIFNDRKNGNEYFLRGIETAKEIVKSAPIEDSVPVNELLKLRDWLYENDAITMNGVKQINQLLREENQKLRNCIVWLTMRIFEKYGGDGNDDAE